MSRSPRAIADFDSASAMLRALAACLRGDGFPALGLSESLRPLAIAANLLPKRVRKLVYAWSGWAEAMPAAALGDVRAETVSRWMVETYPKRRYPAMMLGSSNGAVTHLCALLGIPWLPQTWLIPLRRTRSDPDDAMQALETGMQLAPTLLDANPDLQLHHMHDANQDRLMIRHMTYFRVKKLRLGAAYEAFIGNCLEPGGTIFLVECTSSWPVTQVGDRHYFQHGGAGGIPAEEYIRGSPRVAAFLKREGSPHRAWRSPEPNARAPEAEWGFEAALREDVVALAERLDCRIVRIVFDEPEDFSPLVADLHRWWYARQGLPDDRLAVDSFILMDPYWTLRTASVPFWTKFGVMPSWSALERYLESAAPYDRIGIMLFSHGVESIGLAPIARWRDLLTRARSEGRFLGVDQSAYPADFGAFARYHDALKSLPACPTPPQPLGLVELWRFLGECGRGYSVRWLPHSTRLSS
jgi:hypothetical protein